MDLWKATLCGCFDDCGSCCLTLFCPCCTYGKNVEATTGTGCFVPCITFWCLQMWAPFVIPCVLSSNRQTIRQVYNLPAQVRIVRRAERRRRPDRKCPILTRTPSLLAPRLSVPARPRSLATTAAPTASAWPAPCARRPGSSTCVTPAPPTLPSTSSSREPRWSSSPRPHRSSPPLPLPPPLPPESLPQSSRFKRA